MKISFKNVWSWLILAIITGIFFIMYVSNLDNVPLISFYEETIFDMRRKNLSDYYWNMTCNLKELPKFPEDLKPYWAEDYTKSSIDLHCTKLPVYTKLKNRKLVVLDKDKHCWGRCLTRYTDKSYSTDDWVEPGVSMDCDTVEVVCGNSTDRSEATLFDIHQQLVPKTMPKTIEFLTKKMKAVEFPFMNRIGVNTYPNMIPFLTGKRVEKPSGSLWGTDVPEFPHLKGCSLLGDEDNLFNIFKKHGYVTMFADNYLYPIQASTCNGYKNQLATHVGDYFFLRLHYGRYEGVSIYPKHCFDLTQVIYNYLDSFINSYSDYPKMALIMDVWSSHDDFNDNRLNDAKLLDLLEKNSEELKDSFVIVMSDHGIRMSNALYTHSGQKELNNPTTFITVPESLRENTEVMSIVQENSRQLQTILDTRETMLDIATALRRDNYTNEELFRGEGITSSFLRYQSPLRNCFKKGIELSYCICKMRKQIIPLDTVTAQLVGEAAANQLNIHLERLDYFGKCFEWKLKTIISVEELLEIPNVYITEIKTTSPDAHFRTVIRYEDNINNAATNFDRLDTFGDNGYCADGRYKHICHCKKPFKT